MSLATPKVNAFAVYEPRMKLGNERHFAILRGGNQITPYKINPSSGTNSNLTFSTNPPSNHSILDRVAILKSTWTFSMVQDIANSTLDTQGPVAAGFDAPRSWPVSSVTTQLNCVINGFGDSIQLSQMIHALTRFDSDNSKRNGFQSLTLAMDDNVQDYRCGLGLNTNVLAEYGNNTSNPSRGQYPWTWTVGPVPQNSAAVPLPIPASGTISVDFYEYVVLPPFIWDGCEAGGLTHINQLQFTWTFGSNLQRMWSRCPNMQGTTQLNALTSLNVNYSSSELQLFYITPRLTDVIPNEIIYPYYNIVNYRTTPILNPVAPGVPVANATTNNLQLQAIPSKIIVYVKQSDNVLLAPLSVSLPPVYAVNNQVINQTDSFAQITGINVTWNNNAGLFSSATAPQLWEMSVQNGLTMNYNEWNGSTNPLSQSSSGVQSSLTGSIICFMPGKDLNLSDIEAPGMVGQYNLQIQVSFVNIKPSLIVGSVEQNNLFPEINVTCIYPGIMTIKDNQCSAQIGIVSREEALSAPIIYDTDWNELTNLYGGNFFDSLKSFGKKALNAIRTYGPQILKGIETVAPMIGLGAEQGSAMAAGIHKGKALAAGRQDGGVLIGGKDVSRRKLKDRLAKY